MVGGLRVKRHGEEKGIEEISDPAPHTTQSYRTLAGHACYFISNVRRRVKILLLSQMIFCEGFLQLSYTLIACWVTLGDDILLVFQLTVFFVNFCQTYAYSCVLKACPSCVGLPAANLRHILLSFVGNFDVYPKFLKLNHVYLSMETKLTIVVTTIL